MVRGFGACVIRRRKKERERERERKESTPYVTHRKNNFEVSKHLAKYRSEKFYLLDYQNNYVERSSC